MQIDEAMAMEEVKGLSDNAQRYLQRLWRNQLQVFLLAVETGSSASMMRETVFDMKNMLTKLGL